MAPRKRYCKDNDTKKTRKDNNAKLIKARTMIKRRQGRAIMPN
jgi:hypothetical protein